MKNLVLFSVFAALLSSASAFAEPQVIERVLKDSTTMVAIDLNESTVFCTARGYGTVELKVSVPDLDWLAHFDHRVVGEGQPCITGGACGGDFGPSRLIDSKEPFAIAPVRVILAETLTIDWENGTCLSSLHETVKSLIRGVTFTHYRRGEEKTVDYQKCLKLSEH